MTEPKDPYKILGVSRDAGRDEIKKAYYRMARKYHPDQHLGNTYAEEMFKEVASAYEVLSDDELRERYDLGRSSFSFRATGTPGGSKGVRRELSREEIELVLGLLAAREAEYRAEGWFSDLGLSAGAGRKRWAWFLVAITGVLLLSSIILWWTLSLGTGGRQNAGDRINLENGDYSAVITATRVFRRDDGVPYGRVQFEVEESDPADARNYGKVFTVIEVEKRLGTAAGSDNPWHDLCSLPVGTRLVITVKERDLKSYRLR